MVVVCFSWAGFALLIFFSAPVSLRKLFNVPLLDDFLPQALVSLLGGDVIVKGSLLIFYSTDRPRVFDAQLARHGIPLLPHRICVHSSVNSKERPH